MIPVPYFLNAHDPRRAFESVNQKYPDLTLNLLIKHMFEVSTPFNIATQIAIEYLESGWKHLHFSNHPLLNSVTTFVKVGVVSGMLQTSLTTNSLEWLINKGFMSNEMEESFRYRYADSKKSLFIKNFSANTLGFFVFTPNFIMQCRTHPVESLAELVFLASEANRYCNQELNHFLNPIVIDSTALTAEFLYDTAKTFPSIPLGNEYKIFVNAHIPYGKG